MYFYWMKARCNATASQDADGHLSVGGLREMRDRCKTVAWDTPISAGIYALELDEEEITVAAIMDTSETLPRRLAMAQFCMSLHWAGEFAEEEEITLSRLSFLLEESRLHPPTRTIYKKHGFDLRIRSELNGQEVIIAPGMTLDKAKKRCRELLCEDVLLPEIQRIFSRRASRTFVAHPVHYQIAVSDDSVRADIRQLLLECLYAAGRLPSRRVYIPGERSMIGGRTRWDMDELESMYKMQTGGAIVLPLSIFQNGDAGPHRFDSSDSENMEKVLGLMRNYRRHVLTIMEWPQEAPPLAWETKALLQGMAVVELREGRVSARKARAYLRQRAKQDGLSAPPSLVRQIPSGGALHPISALRALYVRWYDSYLRTDVYPDYHILEEKEPVRRESCGDAYRELMGMIGLKSAKEIVQQILDTYAAERLMEKNNIPIEKTSLHMVFTGNPGTAKTTTARLLAQIFKDNGILAAGDLMEVGRADLVGQYVGSTAPRIRRAFAKAANSVLFIDEAYSLVDDKRGLYGDEAINTIVQEMENHRDNTVVVFAGYPKEMEVFLDRNPGLRSRIAFHIHFEDYNAEELFEILEKMVKESNMELDEGAAAFLRGKFDLASRKKNGGNGRLVRNVLEQAKMRHASRILREKASTAAAVRTMTVEDCQVPAFDHLGEEKKAVGFCVA